MSERIRVDLDEGWEFVRRAPGREWLCHGKTMAGVEVVSLPHCWNVADSFREGVKYYRGPGAYRREFVAPASAGSRVWRLCAEGFYGVGDVWVNGRRAGTVDGQYLGFEMDVTPHLLPGALNRIAIQLTNRCSRWVLPGIADPDFLLYGGLAGRVWMEGLDPIHLEDARTWVRTTIGSGETGRVEAQAWVHNESAERKSAGMRWTLGAYESESVVAEWASPQVAVAPGARALLEGESTVGAVARWTTRRPTLYVLRGVLEVDGRPVDRVERRVGFRTAEFRAGAGFFLNGERIPLRGSNRHECLAGFGNALPLAQHKADARLMREQGLNFVRLSHYPQHPAFLNACDEEGILVYAELASWKSVRNWLWLRRARRQFEGMIRRDHHHPSVILWGMGNESRAHRAFSRLGELAKRLDPDRPVTYAENSFRRGQRARTLGLADIYGCNYELDRLEAGRDAVRLNNVIVSECCNAPHARPGDLEAERAQIAQTAADLARFEDLPYVAGYALWCFNDYATQRKGRFIRYSGLVDVAHAPKLLAAWLRARYAEAPFIKLAGNWTAGGAGGEGAACRLDLFSSCPRVEVRVNGRLIQTLVGRGHHELLVPFEPGRLEARAVDNPEIADALPG